MSTLINKKIAGLKAMTAEAVKEIHQLTLEAGSEELNLLVSELRNRIDEPFMFVVVGEVKSGKSSFVNALLESEEEICAVGPQPVTDTIQQLLFGEEHEVIQINPYLKKIYRPIPILKEIAIVDTPGTNTIVDKHQEITERFIPSADLIVFVFEAKNPYRESAWHFFDFIRQEWQKKVIFVLQQKDLLSEDELQINSNGVKEQAQKKGMKNAPIFATSARFEQTNRKEESGFSSLRTYIKEHITGGQAPALKLENNLTTSINILTKIGVGIESRQKQWLADQAFRKDISDTLNLQENRSFEQLQHLINSLLLNYDHVSSKLEDQLKTGLSFFNLLKKSIQSVFNKKQSLSEWLNTLTIELDDQLHNALSNTLTTGVTDLAESIQQMARIIDLKIKGNYPVVKSTDEIFSDIARRRNLSIEELKVSFEKFLTHTDNFTAHELFPDKESISPNLATGSGIAVIGVILAAVTNGMIFDITGGVLTTIGILFAGISSGSKRKKILNRYSSEIARGRKEMEQEVETKLKAYIHQIKARIDTNFSDFDLLLKEEEQNIEKITKKYESIQFSVRKLQEQLNELTS